MAYSGCDGDVGYKRISSSAKSRINNTRNEVKFIAGAYYDYYNFALNSGYCRSIKDVNFQFGNTVEKFVSNNKIKRESYNRFTRIINKLGPNSINGINKDKFVNAILKDFDDSIQSSIATKVKPLYESFKKMISDNGIKISQTSSDIAFVELIKMLIEATGEDDTITTDLAYSLGLSGILWETPKVVVSDDGCSSRTYGSAIRNYK